MKTTISLACLAFGTQAI